MSRLELVVKVLQNFHQDLPEAERNRWVSGLGQYVGDEAEHISYRLKRAEVERHLQEVGALLFELHEAYACDPSIASARSSFAQLISAHMWRHKSLYHLFIKVYMPSRDYMHIVYHLNIFSCASSDYLH